MLPVWTDVTSYALGQNKGTGRERPVMAHADVYPDGSAVNQDMGNGRTSIDAHGSLRQFKVLR